MTRRTVLSGRADSIAGMSADDGGGVDPAVLTDRFRAQLLTGSRASTVVEVVDRLLAVQAQDPRGFRLAIRVRSTGLTAADVDRALTVDRSVVVAWLNRGTLHLVRAEDHGWLHALTTPQLLAANERRLRQEGLSPESAERGVTVIERSLAADGPRTRGQLRERLRTAGIPAAGQALIHLLFLAELRALTVRGPVVDGEQAHVLIRDWLGPPAPPLDRDTALTRLADRYLAGHGPATDRDLAKWAGLPLREVRRGFAGLGSRLVDLGGGLVRLRSVGGGPEPDAGQQTGEQAERARPVPPPLLLGAFDPVLMGWVSREPVLGGATGIVTTNGIFRPFALVDGRAVATWAMRAGRIVLSPFAPLPPETSRALDGEAADVARFLRR